MDYLSNLKYAKGTRKNKKRVGRGPGSGHGKTSTRGMNGQLSRSGAKKKAWFEGGQMPLQRRVPKFGFTNIFKVEYQVVNVQDLQKLVDAKESVVTFEILRKYGFVRKKDRPVKILGSGELKGKLQVEANAFSKTAQEKIESAGGSITKI
jgi:large subunit ribosomal protein L15